MLQRPLFGGFGLASGLQLRLKGFHVILSPEHRTVGCLPAEEFIDALMKHVGEPYYVGLLSAAEYFGAAHQRPQVFQVVVGRKRKPIRCGKVRIDFIARQNAMDIPCVMRNVKTGYLRLSTPEATAFDLVGYLDRAVGFNHVATVLSELSEEIHDKELGAAAQFSSVAWAQRLGYLLEFLGKSEAVPVLASYVEETAKRTVPLVPWKSMKGAVRNPRWRIAVNEEVEPDDI